MSSENDRGHAELLAALPVVVQDMDQIRQQQWKDVYAVLAGEGAALGLYTLSRSSLGDWSVYLFVILAIWLGLMGVFLVWVAQRDLHRLNQVRQEYLEAFESEVGRRLLQSYQVQDLDRRPVLYTVFLVYAALLIACSIYAMRPMP